MRDTNIYGGKFASRLVLDEPGRPQLYNQWFDFYFLGSDGVTVWNATITTAAQEFWDEVGSLASERAISLLTAEQQDQEFEIKWEGPFLKEGEKHYKIAERQRQTYNCYGGLTRREYQEKAENEIIENAAPVIFESFKIDHSYRYGIGLRAIILAEEINRDVIEMSIDRFRQIGETNWQSEHPVSRDALPFETKEAAFSKIEHTNVLLGPT